MSHSLLPEERRELAEAVSALVFQKIRLSHYDKELAAIDECLEYQKMLDQKLTEDQCLGHIFSSHCHKKSCQKRNTNGIISIGVLIRSTLEDCLSCHLQQGLSQKCLTSL